MTTTSLFGSERERSACGVGLLARRDGQATHATLVQALDALARVEHRGAVAADGRSSDGAGIMTDIPWALIDCEPQSVALASLFIERERELVLELFEDTFRVFDLAVLRYREVPTRPGVLGALARGSLPTIVQAIIARPRACRTEASFEERLYRAKQTTRTRLHERLSKRPRARAGAGATEALSFASLSCRTVVYKALTRAEDLGAFYPDLLNPRYRTRFALFHRRFSTNTRTSWDKAQPFRLIAHNGEINTIAGNRSWSYSREQALGLAPGELLSHFGTSDSGNLNEHVEALRVRSSIPQVEDILAITMPTAGVRNDFYSFWGRAMEPWDGPALIAWADGRAAGARLDRNGFRPARWAQTEALFALASEAGIFGLDPAEVTAQGSLAAGSGVKVDLDTGALHFRDPSVSRENEGARFDARLFDIAASDLDPVGAGRAAADSLPSLEPGQLPVFGLDPEELRVVLEPMFRAGKEALGSMGDTARPAVFSDQVRSFYDYFFQTFAQVTNPPLDYIRERSVTDLSTYLGKRPNIFRAKELLPQTPGLRLRSPVLGLAQMAYLEELVDGGAGGAASKPRLRAVRIDTCVDAEVLEAGGGAALDEALQAIAAKTLAAAEAGCAVVILSDRGASLERPPIPSLLALRAAVVALNREGLRLESSLILDTGDVRSTHQLACAVGFGATAVCPYLACQLAREWAKQQPAGDPLHGRPLLAEGRLRRALEAGLLKAMSKMGISVVRSYQSAKLFSSLGLSQRLLDAAFPGLRSPIGGLDLPELARDMLLTRDAAEAALEDGAKPRALGPLLPKRHLFKEHPRGRHGEGHSMTAARSRQIHRLTLLGEGAGAGSEAEAGWTEHQAAGAPEHPVHLRQLLDLRPIGPALPMHEVEAASAITARFGAGAMSFGAISAEAQRDIIVAMARVGGRSNSGEGGENPWYFVDGTTATTKQVASGRFGVDAEYLVTAEEIEIKIAQGAKPGEGGQLMGVKVDAAIAKARNADEGVTLISPPPMHDIYSIEDLKQLIYELRAVNPWARIAVKLVSGVDIGTIAVGVAKAGADVIHISGGDGGTGAAPLSSMKHAGTPWELGLSEAHRALVEHGMRERVTLRVDGGLSTAFDLIVAAALGAEGFAFGKLLLIAQGCVMARVCEHNRCPRGIATHDPKFKAKYRGSPEAVVALLERLAEDVRELLAKLGVPSIEALVGRAELLRPAARHLGLMQAQGLDLSGLLAGASEPPLSASSRPVSGSASKLPLSVLERRLLGEVVTKLDRAQLGALVEEALGAPPSPSASHEGLSGLEHRLLGEVVAKLDRGQPIDASFPIEPTDRAVLARLSGEIAERAHAGRMHALDLEPRRGHSFGVDPDSDPTRFFPLPESARLEFRGSAGQGFACFLVEGLSVRLVGEANDSVAKGMSGGCVTVVAPEDAGFVAEDNVLIGNCALYGATGGALYLRGRAGDRFAVRNSGARAVLEGAGMHVCEYMTGGVVAVLGPVGGNVGAGMSGGRLYLRASEAEAVDAASVEAHDLAGDEDAELELQTLLEEHFERTGSRTAGALLADWERTRREFVLVAARGSRRARAEAEASTTRSGAAAPMRA